MTDCDHEDERQRKSMATALMRLQISFPRTLVLCVAAVQTRYRRCFHYVLLSVCFCIAGSVKTHGISYHWFCATTQRAVWFRCGNKVNKRRKKNAPCCLKCWLSVSGVPRVDVVQI